ncbi:MAG TPA: RND family transporter [Gammaproteobacteria bacterium]|nr:RND family transporter [Gammaproteobacteria bacterium]
MEVFFTRVIRYRWAVIPTVLVLVAGILFGATKLTFRSDYKSFFKSENAQLQAFQEMQKIYSKSDNVAFIVAPKNGNIFTRKNLTAIWELTDAAWQITYSSRVDSITNFQYSWAEGDNLQIEDLVLEADQLDSKAIARAKRVALSEPLLVKKLISTKGDVAVVNVTIRLPGIDKTREVPEVAQDARKIRDAFRKKYPDINFMLSGMTMLNTSFPEAAQHDVSTLVPIMFLVVIFAIGVLLKSISGTLATLIVIVTSIMTAMGLWGWMGGYLTGPSAAAPTFILTLAVADCVHILATFYYEMRHGMRKKAALISSMRINLQPIFLTSVTTAIGFLTMNFSQAPPFGHLGNIVAMGVTAAFLFSITLFPALMMVLPVRIRPASNHHQDYMDRLADFVIEHKKRLLVVMTFLLLGVSAFVPKNKLDDDFVKYFDTSVPFRRATDFLQEHLSGMATIELSFDSKQSSGVNNPAFLQVVSDFSDWLRQQPETDHVNTITDTLKRLNRNMHGDNPAWYKLPDKQALAAQYLLLYELSLPQGLDINNQLNVDKSSTRVLATFTNLSSDETLKLEQRIRKKFTAMQTPFQLKMASPSLMFAHIGSMNIRSMLLGSFIALLLISLLLCFALRSFKFGLISLLPNLFPAAFSFGLWGLFVGEVGLGLSVVTGMTLGIIVDDTIHFLSKYIRARREKQMNPEQAVRYSFASVGKALWITTLVLVLGFAVMATSSFKVNADMGLLTAVTILVALVVDFLFLPPLLLLFAKRP